MFVVFLMPQERSRPQGAGSSPPDELSGGIPRGTPGAVLLGGSVTSVERVLKALSEAERVGLIDGEEARKARVWLGDSHHKAEKLMDMMIERLNAKQAKKVRQW